MNIPPYGEDLRKISAHLNTLKVVAQSIPNMTVKILPGGFWYNGETYIDFPGKDTPVLTAPQNTAKYILIGLSINGNLIVIDGAESQDPVPPKVQTGMLPLSFVYLQKTSTIITNEMIFDVRPVVAAPVSAFNHNNCLNRDILDAHTISSITNLQSVLDTKLSIETINAYLNAKADEDGTNSSLFTLNKDEAGIPSSSCSLVVERGTENNVSITWDEFDNRWVIDNDVLIGNNEGQGLLFTSNNGRIFRSHVDDNGNLILSDGVITTSVISADEKVKMTSTDTSGYLADKVDTTYLSVTGNKLSVKSDAFDAKGDANLLMTKHTTDYDHTKLLDINKIKINEADLPGYLADKIDTTSLSIVDNKLTVKTDAYDPKDTADLLMNDHMITYNHAKIAEIDAKANQTDVNTALSAKADTTTVNEALILKANTSDVNDAIALKADKSYINTQLDAKANQNYVDAQLGNKADVSYVDTALADKANTIDVNISLAAKANQADVDTVLATKANQNYVDAQLGTKVDQTTLDTALALKTDKTYVDTSLSSKADTTYVDTALSDKVTTSYVDTAVSGKADTTTVNDALALKANSADVNTSLALKADQTTVDTALGNKVDTSAFNDALALKANNDDVNTALALKADQTTVDTALGNKVDTTAFNDALALKADTTTVNTALGAKVDTTTFEDAIALKADATALDNKVDKTGADDITITDTTKGLVLYSPNGTKYRITVSDTGTLSVTSFV